MTKFPRRQEPLIPGTWRPFYRPLAPMKEPPRAIVSCPKCGFRAELDHEIASNGMVTPSVVCPSDACDFHDNILLEDWPMGSGPS